jgi:hypothetical protein
MSLPEPTALPRLPLSRNQEFLCAFDKGDLDGAFGHRHTLAYGWRISGQVETEVLRGALDDVVARNETLRTSISRGEGARYQEIHPPASPSLVERDLTGVGPEARETVAEEFLNELEAGTYDIGTLPQLSAALGRFDDQDSVLVLVAHHTATDAWSMPLILRDLAACYAARRAGGAPPVPESPQYREFVAWQQTEPVLDAIAEARGYWREKLRGAEILALPTDRPRPAAEANAYAVHRFLVDAETTAATWKFARRVRSSPFMVLLAAYKILLHRQTGKDDVVVPTFTSGRADERFTGTVGPFFNFVPLRTDLSGCETFRDVVARTRTTCLDAYSHDIPFLDILAEEPGLVAPFAEDGLAVIAFELLQYPSTMDDEPIGELRYSDIRRRRLSQPVSSDIPDGALWALDALPSGELAGSLKYDRNRFDEKTIGELVEEFTHVLRAAVAAPDAPLTP